MARLGIRTSSRPCARPPSVLQPCIPRRACRCRQTPELQRDMARLGFVVSQIKEIEDARQKTIRAGAETGPQAMVRRLARIVGVGVETADMLVHEVLSRPMRDRRAVARYAGLTGSRDESDARRREQGLARAGNARVRRGMIQLAWRFPMFQKESALALWYRARTADSRSGTRKTMIVPLARKLIIASGALSLLANHWRASSYGLFLMNGFETAFRHLGSSNSAVVLKSQASAMDPSSITAPSCARPYIIRRRHLLRTSRHFSTAPLSRAFGIYQLAKRRRTDRQRPGLGETRTVCWRETDSNFWYRGINAVDFRSIPGIAGEMAGLLSTT